MQSVMKTEVASRAVTKSHQVILLNTYAIWNFKYPYLMIIYSTLMKEYITKTYIILKKKFLFVFLT